MIRREDCDEREGDYKRRGRGGTCCYVGWVRHDGLQSRR